MPLEEAAAVLTAAGIPYRIAQSQNMVVPESELLAVSSRAGTVMSGEAEAVLTVTAGPPKSNPKSNPVPQIGSRRPHEPV